MNAASALTTNPESTSAMDEVIQGISEQLSGARCRIANIFSSPHHVHSLSSLTNRLLEEKIADHVIGCTGEWIAGGGREIEGGPALSVWGVELPETEVTSHRLTYLNGEFQGAPELSEPPVDGRGRIVLLLGDPFSFPVDDWLKSFNESAPGWPVLGGMASAGQNPGSNRLILDGEIFSEGAVALVLEGAFRLWTIVSQGCRPIGKPMIVTRSEGHILRELGRMPALDRLRETFETLGESEKQRIRHGLHLGRVINEYQENFGRGDFLVRNVMGMTEDGGLAINDAIRVGQTVQFHVRDAESADEDLRLLLDGVAGAEGPVASLLFTCNGRGTRLFPNSDHDSGTIQEILGPIPTAGFFAMGEIGPVGRINFLHGFTASIAAFGPVSSLS